MANPEVPENFSDLPHEAYQDTVDLILFEVLGSDDAAHSSQDTLSEPIDETG